MCSHSVLLLGKSDVFCFTKKLFFLPPPSNYYVFYKKVLENFDLIFFFLGFLANIDVFCRKILEILSSSSFSSFLCSATFLAPGDLI